MQNTLFRLRNLNIAFPASGEKAVDDLSFDIPQSKITCLMGQSGSGKSQTALAMIHMASPQADVTADVMRFRDKDVKRIAESEMANIRGKHIFSIYQNPMNAFNANVKMKKQLFRFAKSHGFQDKKRFCRQMAQMLSSFGFADPERILGQYPFQLSGGMLQRVLIAMAMWMEPDLIIADEPTTALDVSLQQEILRQFKAIRDTLGSSVFLITHDFGVVAEIADEVIVMKEGRQVEAGGVFDVFDHPQSSYTKSLLEASLAKEDDA